MRIVLSIHSGFDIAGRMSAGYASAKHMCNAIKVRQSNDSIYRWERRLASAINIGCRDWHASWQAHYSWVHAQPMPEGAGRRITWQVVAHGCDATNTPAAQRCKAMNSETATKNHSDFANDVNIPEEAVAPATLKSRNWPCIFKAPDSCTGASVHAMVLKQLNCLGITSWRDPPVTTDLNFHWPYCYDADDGWLAKSFHLQVFNLHADRGPDQVAAVPKIEREVEVDLFTWVFVHWCKQHSQHLVVKAQLRILERFAYKKYFSAITKIIHLWRTAGNMKLLRAAFVAHLTLSPAEEARLFKRLPPVPLRGRWGSISGTEEWVMQLDELSFIAVWLHVFSGVPEEDLDHAIDAGLSSARKTNRHIELN